MRKYKYFPLYFIYIFCLILISQKFNLIVFGTPIGGHTWSQILSKIPYFIIWSIILAFAFNIIMNNIIKKQRTDTIEAKRRIEEREKYYSSPNTHECRVCGYYSEDFPWGEDGKNPSYQICPCCGVQFGKEDCTLESIKAYRATWKNNGGKWFMKNEKPADWDIEQQMKNIPNEFN